MATITDFVSAETLNDPEFIKSLVAYEREQRKVIAAAKAAREDEINAGKELYRKYLDLREEYMAEADAVALDESGLADFCDKHGTLPNEYRAKR